MRFLAPRQTPRRLEELISRSARQRDDSFAGWQLRRKAPLSKCFPPTDEEIVELAAARIHPFAGSWSGGVLVFDARGPDVEQAAIVEFDAEGSITVLGESFDDFLALLASEEPDDQEDAWTASDDLRAWVLASGVRPHRSAHARLTALAERTRLFTMKWAAALREASRRIRPAEQTEHRLVLGDRLGDVVLGMARAELDARWGPPELPVWGRREDGVTAIYEAAPFVVTLDRHEQRVTGVTLFAGHHRAVTDDLKDLMFLRKSEALAWLGAIGAEAALDGDILVAFGARGAGALRLRLRSCRGGRDAEPWVTAVELVERPL